MKKRLTLFLILSTIIVLSQEKQDNVVYQSGEYLKFKVRYGFLNTSYASLDLRKEVIDGRNVFHAIGKGRTTGLARLFFKVDDTYESYFDMNTALPYVFVRDIYEGGYTKKLKAYFDHSKDVAMVHNLENNSKITISTPKGILDIVSAFYYLRNQSVFDNIKAGDEVVLDMLFDDDEIFKFKLKFIRKEKLYTNFGEVDTMVFHPLVQDGRVFKEQESLTLWISNDKNKLPVQIKADLRVGSLTAELTDFGGLKYPTALKK